MGGAKFNHDSPSSSTTLKHGFVPRGGHKLNSREPNITRGDVEQEKGGSCFDSMSQESVWQVRAHTHTHTAMTSEGTSWMDALWSSLSKSSSSQWCSVDILALTLQTASVARKCMCLFTVWASMSHSGGNNLEYRNAVEGRTCSDKTSKRFPFFFFFFKYPHRHPHTKLQVAARE